MKKIIFLLVLFFITLFAEAQNNKNSKIWNSYSEYNFTKFKYDGVWYPIVDSVSLDYYGAEKYAKSFYGTVDVSYSNTTQFSDFFFHKRQSAKISGLIYGYFVDNYKSIGTKKEKSLVEFFLFVIFLPLLAYFIAGDISYKKFKSSNIRYDLKYFIGSIFFAIVWKDILDWILSNLNVDSDYFSDKFGSNMLFSLVAYILVSLFITKLFTSVEEFFFTKLPTILFSGFIASIITGISYGEIRHIDVLYILGSIIFIHFISIGVNFIKNTNFWKY
jgi:hypothetical protein